MSDRIIKLLGTEVTLDANAPTTLANAQLVRVLPRANTVITIKDGSTITGNISLDTGDTYFVRKKAIETIETSVAGTLVVSVAFGD